MNYTSDSSESITKELAERLEKEHGIKALPVQADMGSENGPAHLIATALNHFAHPKTRKLQIDIIINNAGVASNLPVEKCNAEDFDFVYRVNVRGPLFLMKAAIPYLPTDRSGRVVNVSSVSASCGFSEQSVYGGSKAAVEAMTRTWARELAERTTVNAINPGPVMTGKCHFYYSAIAFADCTIKICGAESHKSSKRASHHGSRTLLWQQSVRALTARS